MSKKYGDFFFHLRKRGGGNLEVRTSDEHSSPSLHVQHVCMYVCMYVCVYGWMYVCMTNVDFGIGVREIIVPTLTTLMYFDLK